MNIVTFAGKNISPGPLVWSFVRGAISLIRTIVSAILLLLSTLFFIWVNQKQEEFDILEDKPKKTRS